MDVSKTIADLSPLEKEVLTLYAIALTPITNEQAAEIASIANLKMSNGKKITRQAFNQVRKDLLEKQLLVQPTTFGYYSHNNFVSNLFLREVLLHEAAQSGQLEHLGNAVKNYFERYSSMYYYGENAFNKYLRQARLAIHLGNFDLIDSIEKEALKSYSVEDVSAFTNIYATIFSTPFRRDWFEKIPTALQKRVLCRMSEISILNGVNTSELEQHINEQHTDLEEQVLLIQLFRGELSRLSKLVIENSDFVPQHLLGALSAMQGDYGAATLHFEAYAKQWRRSVNNKKGVPSLLSYLFYPMTLLGEKNGDSIKKALETSIWQAKNDPEIESALAYVAAGAHYQLNAKQDALSLINGMPVHWERALNALSLVAKTTSDNRSKKTETGATRLIWQVNFESKHLQPLEQKLGKDGLWSGGRNIAHKRLKDLSVDAMTEQDRAVAKAIKADYGWGYGSAQQYYIDWEKAIMALVDHPLLFLQKSPTTAVQLTRGEPNLLVKQKGNAVEIQFDRKLAQPGIEIVKETNPRIERKNDCFTVDGEVEVSEDLVLTMQELTKLLQAGQLTNFVQLSDGQYLALTDQFRKCLAELNSVLDDKMRFHPLAADLVEDFAENTGTVKADKHWKQLLTKLREARAYDAQLPRTFQAELRSYQLEGFKWLSQLAHWGVGACLADDMGLGKTVQALAVLVDRAAQGPALVVAPVSVTRNWEKEAARFAPILRFQIFGSGDRKAMVDNLAPFDVLVTSYNLLQIESEAFENKHFATIILDEAQAIKNRTTKRSKTVMSLQGDFKIITTGTPVENHLGELWNLFNFINPGLLGSIDRFNERFATPIEKYKDNDRRKQLQKIVKPFILRRRKNQVLDELPKKTEIQLTVELSPEERAFYEALHRDAVIRIESENGDIQDKRFRILAELTKLRLASCHPKLAQPDMPLGSSKLELFLETVEELLENNHKALVFSQFVKHLEIVEAELKNRKIRYQYLDGSTPPQKRQERIDTFQRGEGDLFLISLKAGGVGLNLTATDYVIHLDPWWNPAIEYQATDRAHRIGQQRPVTGYHLVAEKTVEEKILKLHEHKRDLADSLLADTYMSGKMSADELLALIRKG